MHELVRDNQASRLLPDIDSEFSVILVFLEVLNSFYLYDAKNEGGKRRADRNGGQETKEDE